MSSLLRERARLERCRERKGPTALDDLEAITRRQAEARKPHSGPDLPPAGKRALRQVHEAAGRCLPCKTGDHSHRRDIRVCRCVAPAHSKGAV